MKLFISWSGDRSRQLAQALREWMPLVLHYVDPWMSEADVEAGDRWQQVVAGELESSNFGILCVTRENLGAPWLLFESGALAKSLQGSRVIPVLLGLDFSEVSGPLAQFQAKKAERQGIIDVVQSINQLMEPEAVPEARVTQLLDALWPQLETKVAAIPSDVAASKPVRPVPEVMEELVTGVRSLDARVRGVEELVVGGSRRRARPGMRAPLLFEFGRTLSEFPGDPIALLPLLASIKDDVPWLYELGMDFYRVVRAGGADPEPARWAAIRLQRALDFTIQGPFIREMDPEFRELAEFVGFAIREFSPSFSVDYPGARGRGVHQVDPPNVEPSSSSADRTSGAPTPQPAPVRRPNPQRPPPPRLQVPPS